MNNREPSPNMYAFGMFVIGAILLVAAMILGAFLPASIPTGILGVLSVIAGGKKLLKD